MFPSKSGTRQISLKAGMCDDAPWYEILLFRTKLRFRNPKRSAKVPRDLSGDDTDLRPFINTESKQGYYKDSEYAYYQSIYRSAWRFSEKGLFARAIAELDFQLCAFAVRDCDQSRFPDLFDHTVGKDWITHYYRSSQSAFDGVSFVPQENGDIEIVFDDEAASKKPSAVREYPIQVIQLNGQLAFQIIPNANQIAFFVPFTKSDTLRFLFQLVGKREVDQDTKQQLLGDASRLANSIMQSLELTYPLAALTDKPDIY